MLTRRTLLAASAGLAIGCRPWLRTARGAAERGAAWLWAQQSAEGAFPSATYGFLSLGQSLTPFALLSLIRLHDVVPVRSEGVSTGLGWLHRIQGADGSIGLAAGAPDYPVYATALTLSCIGAVRPPGWAEVAAGHLRWLRFQQLVDGWEGHVAQGGWPMGGPVRPTPPHPGHVDLSMARRAIEAMRAVDTPLGDPALVAAKGFVERCRRPDAGFVYSPSEEGVNKGIPGEQGASTGYGSATADGLLALTALGAEVDVTVLREMHRVDANPGVGGAFAAYGAAMKGYYRAGAAAVFAAHGGPEGWQRSLADAIVAEQLPDGSWQNDSALQKEDDPIIATGFALHALAACQA